MTKIDIISGFLGSGKTTLIKKLIEEELKDEKIVIIENEFGEIGIDSSFLNEAGINITEMNSGCICCSLVGDFSKALSQVLDEYDPDRIIIEPSGVGKLSDVISAVENIESDKLALNSFSTVVDAKKCKIYHKNFGEFFDNQIKNASTVILSRTSDAMEEKLNICLNIIRELNPNALIVTTDWSKITGKQLLESIEHGKKAVENMIDIHEHGGHTECDCHCNEHHHKHEHHHDHHDHHEHGEKCTCGCHDDHNHEHHHHADEVFASWGTQTTKKYTKHQIIKILDNLMTSNEFGTVLRAKGIVESPDGEWLHFDYVPGESDVRFGHADVTGKICVIGSNINKDKLSMMFN